MNTTDYQMGVNGQIGGRFYKPDHNINEIGFLLSMKKDGKYTQGQIVRFFYGPSSYQSPWLKMFECSVQYL